ncbi:RNA polymerase sporulation sigma factor SigK [Traorella massiliensis]|uniref:RNA polymerase sporulation sigma factor SigK n=1 Tax=Traorella massiliensis TaxID=1903263 RepID=UPI002352CEF0|nr:RNA polymerase sporulation sigma factor SigK [Traorella massiliensis]
MFEMLQLGFMEFLGFCGFIQNKRFKDPLTKQEELRCLERLALKDEQARNMLIEHNLRLVAHIVKKYDIKKMDKDDLISVGTIGLIKAIDTFKLESGHKLTTYAARCIENEILMALRVNQKHSQTVSLNETIQKDNDDSLSLIDCLASNEEDVIDTFMKKENIQKMMSHFKILDEREKDILMKRYGLFNHEEMTQKAIAQEYNISRSYVSRIEKRAIIQLCKAFYQ